MKSCCGCDVKLYCRSLNTPPLWKQSRKRLVYLATGVVRSVCACAFLLFFVAIIVVYVRTGQHHYRMVNLIIGVVIDVLNAAYAVCAAVLDIRVWRSALPCMDPYIAPRSPVMTPASPPLRFGSRSRRGSELPIPPQNRSRAEALRKSPQHVEPSQIERDVYRLPNVQRPPEGKPLDPPDERLPERISNRPLGRIPEASSDRISPPAEGTAQQAPEPTISAFPDLFSHTSPTAGQGMSTPTDRVEESSARTSTSSPRHPPGRPTQHAPERVAVGSPTEALPVSSATVAFQTPPKHSAYGEGTPQLSPPDRRESPEGTEGHQAALRGAHDLQGRDSIGWLPVDVRTPRTTVTEAEPKYKALDNGYSSLNVWSEAVYGSLNIEFYRSTFAKLHKALLLLDQIGVLVLMPLTTIATAPQRGWKYDICTKPQRQPSITAFGAPFDSTGMLIMGTAGDGIDCEPEGKIFGQLSSIVYPLQVLSSAAGILTPMMWSSPPFRLYSAMATGRLGLGAALLGLSTRYIAGTYRFRNGDEEGFNVLPFVDREEFLSLFTLQMSNGLAGGVCAFLGGVMSILAAWRRSESWVITDCTLNLFSTILLIGTFSSYYRLTNSLTFVCNYPLYRPDVPTAGKLFVSEVCQALTVKATIKWQYFTILGITVVALIQFAIGILMVAGCWQVAEWIVGTKIMLTESPEFLRSTTVAHRLMLEKMVIPEEKMHAHVKGMAEPLRPTAQTPWEGGMSPTN